MDWIRTPQLRGWTSDRQCGSPWSEQPVENAIASLPSIILLVPFLSAPWRDPLAPPARYLLNGFLGRLLRVIDKNDPDAGKGRGHVGSLTARFPDPNELAISGPYRRE